MGLLSRFFYRLRASELPQITKSLRERSNRKSRKKGETKNKKRRKIKKRAAKEKTEGTVGMCVRLSVLAEKRRRRRH
jgi:hypothetical protein